MTKEEIKAEFDRTMAEIERTARDEGYEGFLRAVNEFEDTWIQDMRDRGSVTDVDAVRAAIVWAFKNKSMHDDFDNYELEAFVAGARWMSNAKNQTA